MIWGSSLGPHLHFFADKAEQLLVGKVPRIFALMQPMPGAIAAYELLSKKYDERLASYIHT